MDELVTVIIPIYNVDKYLKRCVDSVLNQTYQNLEIILVDDGSTDASGIIVDEYKRIDNRVIVYHKKNGGLSEARNYALDRMNGRYVTFIDSDDYVNSRYIEVLYNSLKIEDSDISIVDTKLVFNEKNEQNMLSNYQLEYFDKIGALKKALCVELRQSAWGKLYRSDLFNTIRFPKGKLYEDLAVVFDILALSSKVIYAKTPLYYYMIRNNSIMQEDFSIKQFDEIEIIETAMQRLLEKEEFQSLKKLCQARQIYSYFVVLRRILYSKEKNNYLEQRKLLCCKIKKIGKKLYFDKSININVRIRLMSYIFGEHGFMCLQRVVDYLSCIKYKQRFM